MPTPRKSQIAVEATPYYHCVSRCVRRAFLCCNDRFSGRSYEHRRAFIEQEILRLGQVFYLDVAAYAVMSNHYHVVLFVDQNAQKLADDRDIVARWHQIHKGNKISRKYIDGEYLEPYEIEQLRLFIGKWRVNLASISWYMRVLNEKVARKANREDEVTGRFWEGRFKCQALLDEQALLSCMAYVDLNPIRSGMANSLEKSDHTSIKLRKSCWEKIVENKNDCVNGERPGQADLLHSSTTDQLASGSNSMVFNIADYLKLVDWTARKIVEKNAVSLNCAVRPVLKRLSISPEHWIYICTHFESRFKGLVGTAHSLKQACPRFNRYRVPNLSTSIFVH